MLRSTVSASSIALGKLRYFTHTFPRSSSTFSNEEVMKYLNQPPHTLPTSRRLVAPPMVYIAGEEMTHYTMKLM